MIKVKVEDYAQHRKITARSVWRHLASGLIPKSAVIREGRRLFIDQAKADKALGAITSRKEILGRAEPKVKKTAEPTDQEKVKTAARGGTSGLSFHEARTVKERYKAALLKIEFDEKMGALVDAEKVKLTAYNTARQVRDALLNIPTRISAILAAESDQNRVAEILTGEIRQALEALTKGGTGHD
jgi:hypothetical protein